MWDIFLFCSFLRPKIHQENFNDLFIIHSTFNWKTHKPISPVSIGRLCWLVPFIEAKVSFKLDIFIGPFQARREEGQRWQRTPRHSRLLLSRQCAHNFRLPSDIRHLNHALFLDNPYAPFLNARCQGTPKRISFVLVTQIGFAVAIPKCSTSPRSTWIFWRVPSLPLVANG